VSRPYHIAPSLKALFAEVNRLAPRRSKRSDGGVGDARHQKQKSDHNPDFSAGGVVRAIDVTHDPKGGLDCNALARTLRTRRDPRINYVIFNRKIMYGNDSSTPWRWHTYKRENPHTTHLHVSIRRTNAAASDTGSWLGGAPVPFIGGSVVPIMKGWDEMATKEEIKAAVREVLRDELGIVLRGDPGTTDGGTHPHNLQNINKTLGTIIEGDPQTPDGGTHPHNLRNINRTVNEINSKID
jgi:hypothetical protein